MAKDRQRRGIEDEPGAKLGIERALSTPPKPRENMKLGKRKTRKPSPLKYIPDADQALSDWTELKTLLGFENPDFLSVCGKLIDEGLPFFRVQGDGHLTETTGRFVVRYELADRLQILLSAVRANKGHAAEIEGRSDKALEAE